ncbi:MAG: HipA domain-containing protein [Alphaproteobacteria bacterium]
MITLLRVGLNDRTIGTLTQLRSGGIFFAFDEDYLSDTDRPVLSQSFFRPSGDIIPESKITSGKLPAFFSNLLPEGHMRDYLAQRGGIKSSQEFRLIELLGQDLPGAVIITPMDGTPADRDHTHEPDVENGAPPYRFSLAGVQLKFSAIGERHGRLTIPANGIGGDWIIKLPAQNYPHVPENEYAMMSLAARIGIPVPEIKLVSLKDIGGLPEMGVMMGKQALAVRRFDRPSNAVAVAPLGAEQSRSLKIQRVHFEDFAQVYDIFPDKKYEGVSFANIAGMVWTLTGEEGLVDFIRRLTFTILIGNGDMHLKNWSFIYKDGKTPSLSPAYDMLSTVPYIPHDGLALKLADTKDMQAIELEHFRKLASKAQVPEHLVMQTVRDTIEATHIAWAEIRKHSDLPPEIGDLIQKHMDGVGLKS